MIIDKSGKKWYKIGLHIHTSLSDGAVSPEDAAKRYKEAGFDAVAFTDHWVFGEEQVLSDLKILSGCEYNVGGSDTSDCVMHIVGVGMKYKPEITEDMHRQQIIDKINEADGIAILAHPACCWAINLDRFVNKLVSYGLDGMEVYYPYKRHRGIIKFHKVKTVEKIADKYGLIKTGGTDLHETEL